MTTQAMITLHNLAKAEGSAFNTVSFLRQCDGDMSFITANMFYRMFDNQLNAKGSIEKMICSDPSQLAIYSFEPVLVNDCMAQYHYHLDMVTMDLIVIHKEKNVFKGKLDLFVNTYSNKNCSVVSYKEYNPQVNTLYSLGYLLGHMRETAEVMISLLNRPSNPLIKTYSKRLDRFDVFLSDMKLSEEEREVRAYLQRLNLEVQNHVIEYV